MGQIMSVILYVIGIILLAAKQIDFYIFRDLMIMATLFSLTSSVSSISLYLKEFKDNLFFMSAEKQELNEDQKEKINEIVGSRK